MSALTSPLRPRNLHKLPRTRRDSEPQPSPVSCDAEHTHKGTLLEHKWNEKGFSDVEYVCRERMNFRECLQIFPNLK